MIHVYGLQTCYRHETADGSVFLVERVNTTKWGAWSWLMSRRPRHKGEPLFTSPTLSGMVEILDEAGGKICCECIKMQEHGYRACNDHEDGPSDDEQIDRSYPIGRGFVGS